MCEIILFIGMFVLGIYALITGKVKLTNTQVVTGVPARLIGVILLLPFPLTLLAGVALGVYLLSEGPPETVQQRMPVWGVFIGFGLVVLCGLLAVFIGVLTAKSTKKKKADPDDDYPPRDEDDRPRRGGPRDENSGPRSEDIRPRRDDVRPQRDDY